MQRPCGVSTQHAGETHRSAGADNDRTAHTCQALRTLSVHTLRTNQSIESIFLSFGHSLRVMSLNALLQLVNGHASGAFSDYELSRRLHSLDGKGGFYYV